MSMPEKINTVLPNKKHSHPTVIKRAKSTPSVQQTGVNVTVPLVKLSPYTVNLRSFHPNIKFEKGGLRFDGDSRGFSLGKSEHPTADYVAPSDKPKTTSRIYQRMVIPMAKETDLSIKKTAQVAVSNKSDNTAPGWSLFAATGGSTYDNPKYQPQGTVSGTVALDEGGRMVADLKSHYGGMNFAFVGSKQVQDTTGKSVVPDLDVYMRLWLRVERVNHYMDIMVLVDGDGFPNCEGFITDAKGESVFLGTHIRVGVPLTHLFGNSRRLMFAHALRVGLDNNGNFTDKLWTFAHVLGDRPTDRDRAQLVANRAADWLDNAPDDFERIGDGKQGVCSINAPLYLPVDKDPQAVWAKLRQSFYNGPIDCSLNRSAWNQWHLKRNPNEGRMPDAYDYKPSK